MSQSRNLRTTWLVVFLYSALEVGFAHSAARPPANLPAREVNSAAASSQTASAPAAHSAPLPGKGLAQHPFLYCGEWQQQGESEQTMYIVRGGKVVWMYSIPSQEEMGDCTMLSNGNILFSRRLGASEITPDKTIVWNYDAPPNTEIHSVQPISEDRVLLMQNGDPAELILINKRTGKAGKQLILQTRNPKGIHGQFRHVRMTKAGTLLVPHMDMGKVIEYDWSGKQLWSLAAPSVWAAVRLENGDTLISGN